MTCWARVPVIGYGAILLSLLQLSASSYENLLGGIAMESFDFPNALHRAKSKLQADSGAGRGMLGRLLQEGTSGSRRRSTGGSYPSSRPASSSTRRTTNTVPPLPAVDYLPAAQPSGGSYPSSRSASSSRRRTTVPPLPPADYLPAAQPLPTREKSSSAAPLAAAPLPSATPPLPAPLPIAETPPPPWPSPPSAAFPSPPIPPPPSMLAPTAPVPPTSQALTPAALAPKPSKSPASCMWRQTGQCSPTGAREPINDKVCTATIPVGHSGFCDCDGNNVVDSEEFGYDCSITPGKCSYVCHNSGLPTHQEPTGACSRTTMDVQWSVGSNRLMPALFGPSIVNTSNFVVKELALVDPPKGCTLSAANHLVDKIALIQRGDCTFVQKVQNVQDAGAVAAIIFNNVDGGAFRMGGETGEIIIPAFLVEKSSGEAMNASISAGATNVSLICTAYDIQRRRYYDRQNNYYSTTRRPSSFREECNVEDAFHNLTMNGTCGSASLFASDANSSNTLPVISCRKTCDEVKALMEIVKKTNSSMNLTKEMLVAAILSARSQPSASYSRPTRRRYYAPRRRYYAPRRRYYSTPRRRRRYSYRDECNAEKEFRNLVVNGTCGNASVFGYDANRSNASLATFCTQTCSEGLRTVAAGLLRKAACRFYQRSIQTWELMCHRGTNGYCLSSEIYGQLSRDLLRVQRYEKNINVTQICKPYSCFRVIVTSRYGHQSTWGIILKHLCIKPAGRNETCWDEFADIFGKSYYYRAYDPIKEALLYPEVFCPSACKRMAVQDVYALANSSESYMSAVEGYLKFACLKNEFGHYCYKAFVNAVETPAVLNYDNSIVTKVACYQDPSTARAMRDDMIPEPSCYSSPSMPTTTTITTTKMSTSPYRANWSDGSRPSTEHYTRRANNDYAHPADYGSGRRRRNFMDCKRDLCAPWCKSAQLDDFCIADLGCCNDVTVCERPNEYLSAPHTKCSCATSLGQTISSTGCCAAAAMELYSAFVAANLLQWDNETVDIAIFETDLEASSQKGFRVSKATTFLETCGYVADPKCTLGRSMKQLEFMVALDNIDSEQLCGNESAVLDLEEFLVRGYSSMLGGSASDYTIKLCSDVLTSSRRLSRGSDDLEFTFSVRVTESPATDIDILAQVKEDKELSGEIVGASVDMFEAAAVPKVNTTMRSMASVGVSWNSTVGGFESSSVADLQTMAKVMAIVASTRQDGGTSSTENSDASTDANTATNTISTTTENSGASSGTSTATSASTSTGSKLIANATAHSSTTVGTRIITGTSTSTSINTTTRVDADDASRLRKGFANVAFRRQMVAAVVTIVVASAISTQLLA